jgi:hypothetical protein
LGEILFVFGTILPQPGNFIAICIYDLCVVLFQTAATVYANQQLSDVFFHVTGEFDDFHVFDPRRIAGLIDRRPCFELVGRLADLAEA